jgi:hypothetical protein
MNNPDTGHEGVYRNEQQAAPHRQVPNEGQHDSAGEHDQVKE